MAEFSEKAALSDGSWREFSAEPSNSTDFEPLWPLGIRIQLAIKVICISDGIPFISVQPMNLNMPKEIKRNRPNNIFFVSTAYDRRFDTWTTPSSSFMTLLKKNHPRARPFKSGVSRGIKIINPENSRNSLMYFIRIESYYPDGTLRVLAGSTRGILNAMGTAYRMMIVDGAWTIIDERPWAA